MRPLRALQVEVTSRCTRRCVVCPRSSLAGRWREGDLSADTWARLAPDLQLARHVHLQGWGEPLLHAQLPRMVGEARQAGCRVGITTNGDRLGEAASWLAREKVDVVSVSVAGGWASHATVRDGSDLTRVWDAIAAVAAKRRSKRPRLQVSYLLTAENAHDLPQAVGEAATAGADELFVVHVDVTPAQETLERCAFAGGSLRPDVMPAVEAAAEIARRRRIAFRPPPLGGEELLVCSLDPRRFAFVGFDGRVGPCVNLLLPVSGPIPRATEVAETAVPPVVYASLRDARLREILEGEPRRAFVEPFARRIEIEQRFRAAQGGWGEDALRRLADSDEERQRALRQNPLPRACTGCHKALGW